MAPCVLLLTTVNWPSAARLAGAFAAVGAEVAALFPAGHVLAHSRFLKTRHAYSPLAPLTSVARAIARSAPDLVVPCDDRALSLLLPLAGTQEVVARSLGAPQAYATLTARSAFIDAARALGIAAPETIAISSEAALDAALARIGLPAVLKADASWGGEGVGIAHTRDEALRIYRRLSAPASRLRNLARAARRRDGHFLRDALHPRAPVTSVQRHVAGRPATSAFACWKGRVLATIHMDVLETTRLNGPASVLRRTDCRAMEIAAVKIAERFGLSGLHGLDFVRDPAGRPHLIEINPRATQASALALGPAHDAVAAMTACLTPLVQYSRPAATQNRVIALFPQEWRRNPQSPWLSTAFLDVPWDDPGVLHALLGPGEPEPSRRAETQSARAPAFAGLPVPN